MVVRQCTIRASSWKDALSFYERLRNQDHRKQSWVFRGMGDYTWKLQTSLERAMARFGQGLYKARERENGLLREFKRHFHHYESYRPDDANTVEWLATMQHHFAPTRFLDWTRSFYVALYFALEKAEGDSAVWCIDENWCSDTVMQIISKSSRLQTIHGDNGRYYHPGEMKLRSRPRSIPFGKDNIAFNEVFCSSQAEPFVYPLNPLVLNERLAVQQGLFICPGDINRSFEDNLREMGPDRRVFKRLRILSKATNEILRELYRELYRMNITRASLFPGLDGFAESLGPRLVLPESLPPDNADC